MNRYHYCLNHVTHITVCLSHVTSIEEEAEDSCYVAKYMYEVLAIGS